MCLMEMKSERVPGRRPHLYFPFDPIRTEFQNQSGILTTAQLNCACKRTDCFPPEPARAIASFFPPPLSGWLSPSVLHRLGLLHKVDLVKFHSAHLLPAPLSSESFTPQRKQFVTVQIQSPTRRMFFQLLTNTLPHFERVWNTEKVCVSACVWGVFRRNLKTVFSIVVRNSSN